MPDDRALSRVIGRRGTKGQIDGWTDGRMDRLEDGPVTWRGHSEVTTELDLYSDPGDCDVSKTVLVWGP